MLPLARRPLFASSLLLLTSWPASFAAQASENVFGGVSVAWSTTWDEIVPQAVRANALAVRGKVSYSAATRSFVVEPTADGLISARESDTGVELWSTVIPLLPTAIEISPVGDRLYVLGQSPQYGSPTARIACLDPGTGAVLWTREPAANTLATTGLTIAPNGSLVYASGNLADGTGSWIEAFTPASSVTWTQTVSHTNGLVADLVATSNGVFAAIADSASNDRIEARASLDGSLRWSYPTSIWSVSDLDASPDGSSIAFGSQAVSVLDESTGNLRWSVNEPLAYDNRLRFGASSQRLYSVARRELVQVTDPRVQTRAFDSANGNVLWSSLHLAPAGGVSESGLSLDLDVAGDESTVLVTFLSLASGTPTFLGGVVSLASLAVDASNGQERWVKSWPTTEDSTTSTPLIASRIDATNGNAVLLGSQVSAAGNALFSRTIGFDPATGALGWSLDGIYLASARNYARACALSPDNTRIAVVSTAKGYKDNGSLRLLDAASGATLWSRVPDTLLSGARHVVFASDANRVFWSYSTDSATVEALDATTGQVQWVNKTAGNSAPLIAQDPSGARLFQSEFQLSPGSFSLELGSLETRAVDSQTGAQLWQHTWNDLGLFEDVTQLIQPAGSAQVFVVVRLRKLSATQVDDLLVLALDASSGNELWSTHIEEAAPSEAPSAVTFDPIHKTLFVGGISSSASQLFAIESATGSILWDLPAFGSSAEFGPVNAVWPLQSGQRLLVATDGKFDLLRLEIRDASNGFLISGSELPDSLNTTLTDLQVSEDLQTVTLVTTEHLPMQPGWTPSVSYEPRRRVRTLDLYSFAPLWETYLDPASGESLVLDALLDPERGRLVLAGGRDTVAESWITEVWALDVPNLIGQPASVSLAAGGSQNLELRAGHAYAGSIYLLLGSASGTSPGLPIDTVTLPLVFDTWTQFTLQSPNQGPLVQTLGTMNGAGQGFARLDLPGNSPASLAGLTLFHAFVSIRFLGPIPSVDFASNPLALELAP